MRIPFLFWCLRDILYWWTFTQSIRDRVQFYKTARFTDTSEVGLLRLVGHPFAPLPLQKLPHYYGLGWLLIIRCYYAFSAHETSRDKSYIFPRLLSWFTHIGYDYLLDFRVSRLLIRYIRLTITFLFVEPRFRYPFLSPLPHDSQAWESLLGSPVAGAHGGLTPQMHDMPVVHIKTRFLTEPRSFI